MKKFAITLGDTRGVGAEITLKALKRLIEKDDAIQYTIFGDCTHLKIINNKLNINCPFVSEQNSTETSKIIVKEIPGQTFLSPAQKAVLWIETSAKACLNKEFSGMITAPVNKEEIINAGFPSFIGQTEFLSDLANTRDTSMMLMGNVDANHSLRIILATTHIRITKISQTLTVAGVLKSIRNAHKSCKLLKLSRSKIGICGLNPHAGEGGKIGDEEQTIILPAISQARKEGIEVSDPIAADALLRKAWMGEFDVLVTMYHDQGLPALKMVAFDKGINWTIGLPFVRVSPDHGTAFDIAGKGIASESSMIEAIQLIKQIS